MATNDVKSRFDALLNMMAKIPVSVVEGTPAKEYPASDAEPSACYDDAINLFAREGIEIRYEAGL